MPKRADPTRPRPGRRRALGKIRLRVSTARDLAILILILAGLLGALWAARELCRANPGCPWTVLY